MAIFHKDGKVYTLKNPNPIVKNQVSWDRSSLIFHNFEWDEITCEMETKVPKILPKEEEVGIPSPPEKKAEPENGPEPPEDKDDREFDLPDLKYKVLSYCLPAHKEKKTDALYGDTWGRIKYGQKFAFPSVVISSTDIMLEFWTSDPREQITEGSIIYPYSYEVQNKKTGSYDKVPYDEYRWWKVSSKERKEQGWLFSSIPSDKQPDFSS